jgi:hypothetical protein
LDQPKDCADAALYELAGAEMSGEERTATLRHGELAVHELARQVTEARAWSRLLWLWAVAHGDGQDILFEGDVPNWLREG